MTILDLKNLCHGYIGMPLKNQHGLVVGHGVRTRIENKELHVVFKLNYYGRKELDAEEVEAIVLIADE